MMTRRIPERHFPFSRLRRFPPKRGVPCRLRATTIRRFEAIETSRQAYSRRTSNSRNPNQDGRQHDASDLTAVAIAPDLGERYLDTIYQSSWRQAMYGQDLIGAGSPPPDLGAPLRARHHVAL